MFVKMSRAGVIEGMCQCSHIEVTHYPAPGSVTRTAQSRETGLPPFTPDEVGINVECCGLPDGSDLSFRIPRDGESIYVTNDDGKTIQTYHVDGEGRLVRRLASPVAASASS